MQRGWNNVRKHDCLNRGLLSAAFCHWRCDDWSTVAAVGCDGLLHVVGSALLSEAAQRSVDDLLWSLVRPWAAAALGRSVAACGGAMTGDGLLWLLCWCAAPLLWATANCRQRLERHGSRAPTADVCRHWRLWSLGSSRQWHGSGNRSRPALDFSVDAGVALRNRPQLTMQRRRSMGCGTWRSYDGVAAVRRLLRGSGRRPLIRMRRNVGSCRTATESVRGRWLAGASADAGCETHQKPAETGGPCGSRFPLHPKSILPLRNLLIVNISFGSILPVLSLWVAYFQLISLASKIPILPF